jgi:hypothetical protein
VDAGSGPDSGAAACANGLIRGPYGCEPRVAASCPIGARPALFQDECAPVGPAQCPDGFTKIEGAWGCHPILAQDCPAGARAQLGQGSCVPVGWHSCPSGFSPAADGWGCEAVLPQPRCDEGQRDVLGSTRCLPIGDCAAPLPAEVTRFVDPNRAEDATHHHTITAAIRAAAPGEVIGVEAGDYAEEGLQIDKPLRLLGRCTDRVRLSGTGTVPGIGVSGVDAELSGLTLIGHRPGLLVANGAQVNLHSLQLTTPVTAGILVLHAGTKATIGEVRIDRPSALGQTPGVGVQVQRGGRAELNNVQVEGSSGYGLVALESGSVLTATRAVLRDVRWLGPGGAGGQAVIVGQGARAHLADSVIRGADRGGLAVNGGHLTVHGLELSDAGRNRPRDAAAVNANTGGVIELLEVRIARSRGVGAGAFDGGARLFAKRTVIVDGELGGMGLGLGVVVQGNVEVNFSDVAILRQPSAAIAAYNGRLEVQASLLGPGSSPNSSALIADGTQIVASDVELYSPSEGAYNLDVRGARARAVISRAILRRGPSAVFDGAELQLSESAVLDSWDVGFFVGNSLEGQRHDSRLVLRDSHLARNISSNDPGSGGGIFFADQSRGVVEGCTFQDNNTESISVAAEASLELKRSVLLGTLRGVDGKKGMALHVWGRAQVEDVAFLANAGGGLVLRGTGSATISGSLFHQNRLLGVFSDYEAKLRVERSAVLHTAGVADPRTTDGFGMGALVGGDAVFRETLVQANRFSGLALGSARRPQSQVRVEACVIRDTLSDGTAYGHGLASGPSAVRVQGSYLLDNKKVGLAFVGATALVGATVIAGNLVGTHVQDGTVLRDLAAAPEQLTTLEAIFTADALFLENGSKVGVGELPLPPPIDPELGPERPRPGS